MLPSRTNKSTRQGLLYSAAKKCYRTVRTTITVDGHVRTYTSMPIALSLRVHHRAQRLFTIPLRGSAVNLHWAAACQSIRRSKISPCAVQYAPIARLALFSAPIDRCCRAICPYCTVGSFGRHFLINVMWHGFDQSHFEYILRCYINWDIPSKSIVIHYWSEPSSRQQMGVNVREWYMRLYNGCTENWNITVQNLVIKFLWGVSLSVLSINCVLFILKKSQVSEILENVMNLLKILHVFCSLFSL